MMIKNILTAFTFFITGPQQKQQYIQLDAFNTLCVCNVDVRLEPSLKNDTGILLDSGIEYHVIGNTLSLTSQNRFGTPKATCFVGSPIQEITTTKNGKVSGNYLSPKNILLVLFGYSRDNNCSLAVLPAELMRMIISCMALNIFKTARVRLEALDNSKIDLQCYFKKLSIEAHKNAAVTVAGVGDRLSLTTIDGGNIHAHNLLVKSCFISTLCEGKVVAQFNTTEGLNPETLTILASLHAGSPFTNVKNSNVIARGYNSKTLTITASDPSTIVLDGVAKSVCFK